MTAVLVQIDGHDPVAGAGVTLRAASIDDDRVCHLNDELWWPALSGLPTLRYDLFDGAFGNAITTPQSALTLVVEAWPQLPRYMLADARIRVWTGAPGDAWGGYTLRFDGRVTSQPAVADGLATINFAVDDRWLDAPLLATYAGTTGAEGEAALKGQAKPLAIGAPRFVPGQMIDNINNVVQLSAYGAIEGVETAFERLVTFQPSAGDHASYAALIAADIPAGAWATAKAVGMVRHGAPPAGRLSYHVSGDRGGPDGWVRQPGSIIRRLALLSGGAGKTNDAALGALNVARPYPLSLYQGEQTTARDLIQRIAASVNAVAGVSWLGTLWAVPIGFGAAALTLDAGGGSLPPVASVEQMEVGAPWWRLAIGAERTWNVHPLSDVAFSAELIDRGLYDPAESYREGHIVDTGGGARFLFIATTPATGATLPSPTFPPAAPAQNAHWQQLRPPATYADGTPMEDLQPAGPGATPGAPGGTQVGGVLNPVTGEVVGGVEADELVEIVDNTVSGLADLGELVDAEVARIDTATANANERIDDVEDALTAAETALGGSIAAANGRIDGVVATLTSETTRIDADITAANAAIVKARAALAYQFGRLQIEIAQTRIGILAEYQERVSAIGVQITRIDGLIAQLGNPSSGLPAAHALIATLESVTVNTSNPLSLASKLAVLEAAITAADTALSARVATLETVTAQHADDIADLGDGLGVLDAGLVAANAAIAGNASGLVSLAGRADTVEAALVTQGNTIAATQASLTSVQQAVALENAAGVYQARRAALQIGQARISALAEMTIRATDTTAIYSAINVVDLKITTPGSGINARLSAVESAAVDLAANKASVSALNALSASVSGIDGRLASAEGGIVTLNSAVADLAAGKAEASALTALSAVVTSQGEALEDLGGDLGSLNTRLTTAEAGVTTNSNAIAGLNLNLAGLDGALGLVATNLSALSGRVTDAEADIADHEGRLGSVEGATAAIATTVGGISVSIADLQTRANDADSAINALGGRQTVSEAAITNIQGVGVTRDAALAYDARRMAIQIGLSRVTDLAERQITLTETSAAATRLDAIELNISAPTTGLTARIASLDTAVANLATSTVTLTQFNTLSATVTGHTTSIGALQGRANDAEAALASLNTRVTTTEGAITTQAGVISSLTLDVTGLTGTLGVLATGLGALDGRVNDVEAVAGTLVAATNSLSASVATQAGQISGLDNRQTLSEAAITAVQGVAVTDRAALAHDARRTAVRVGLSGITAIAEQQLRVTAETAIYNAINVVDLKITTPVTGLAARIASNETALVGVNLSLGDLGDALTLTAGDLSALTGRVNAAEGTLGSLVTTTSIISAALDDLETEVSTKAGVTYVDAAIATEAGARAAAISSVTAAVGGVNALNKNAAFADYPNATGAPTTWDSGTVLEGASAITRVTGQVSPYAMQISGAAGHQAYTAQVTGGVGDRRLVGNQWVVVEADVTLVSGALTGAGVLFRSYDTSNAYVDYFLNFASDISATGVPVGAGTAGRRYSFAKMIHVTQADAAYPVIFAMAHFSAFGSMANANAITFHRIAARPATEREINSKTVDTNLAGLTTVVSTKAGVTYVDEAIATEAGARAAAISSVTAAVNENSAAILDIADVAANADGTARAVRGLVLDVNGKISGWRSENDGTTSSFDVLADNFKVTPSAGGGVEIASNKLIMRDNMDRVRFRIGDFSA